MRILIVDNATLVIKRLEQLILETRRELSVWTAVSYNMAVKIINEERPHIIMVDINLPDNLGVKILRKANTADVKMIVIVYTNCNDSGMQQKCLDLGVHHFVDKYYDFEKLPGILAEAYDQLMMD